MLPSFGAAYAAPNEGTIILYLFRPPKTVLNPLANDKIQGFFKAFVFYSSAFQGKLNFQGFFKTILYIQVLLKPVRTLNQMLCYKIKWKLEICSSHIYGPRCEKTCLWGLRTTKVQTSLRIGADWSAPLLFAFWKVSYLNLLKAKFQFSS